MKPVPLLLLLSLVLLASHLRPAAGRPRFLPGRPRILPGRPRFLPGRPRFLPGWLDGSGRLQTQQLDEVLLGAAAAGHDLLGDDILRFLRERSPDPLDLLPPEEDEAVRTAVQLLKRSEDPPLSIDLTFHLLRNMIQMAKMESQREQALLNRKVLDEVGK